MRLIGIVSTFQNADNLDRTLKSLFFCDKLVVVDGAYSDFPDFGFGKFSTDNTEIVCKNNGAEYYQFFGTEAEKRTECFVGEEGDWYLRLDDDEVLVGMGIQEEDFLRKKLQFSENNFYWLMLVSKICGRWLPRLVKHVPGGLQHVGKADDKIVSKETSKQVVFLPEDFENSFLEDEMFKNCITPNPYILHLGNTVRNKDYLRRKTVMFASRTGNKLGDDDYVF